jgi:CRISPR-associated protein Cas1
VVASDELPDLVPARMVNEFAYCPRLFFLEWVQARFADNSDTVDGRYQHRVVDAETGRAPEPAQAEDLRGARSLLISAPSLGLVGRIDLLEGRAGVVTPVDYKRGSPAPGTARAWEPERRQLAVHALMLRDAGYVVDRAVLYFVEARQRIDVELTEELLTATLASVAELREVASRDQAPPPLVDSPKCPRCSLVGLCLPDEHNLLLARSQRAPRRLVPSAQAARPLYVTEAGSSIAVRSERVEITGRPSRDPGDAPPRKTSVRLLDVSQVNVFGNVQVSTQAMRQLFARDVPVLFFSGGGWLEGLADGLPSKHVQLRIRQVAAVGHGGLPAARMLVRGKIRNSRVLLRRNSRADVTAAVAELGELSARAASTDSVASLLGIEGAAARAYFRAFSTMIRSDQQLPGLPFAFEGRNRRPPRDAVNCLLSFCYAMLVKDLVATCIGVGLDPYIGVYHRPRFGRPALALDLAEEFRPLVADSVAVNAINNGEVKPTDFVVRAGGVALTGEGRKAVIAAYERRLDVEVTHPVYRYRISYRRVLEVQARVLAAWLLGEVPDYAAFTTR